MIAYEWEGFPPVGTRLRVPFGTLMTEGEVLYFYLLFGKPVAQLCVQVPRGLRRQRPPFLDTVTGAFPLEEVEAMEVIAD